MRPDDANNRLYPGRSERNKSVNVTQYLAATGIRQFRHEFKSFVGIQRFQQAMPPAKTILNSGNEQIKKRKKEEAPGTWLGVHGPNSPWRGELGEK